MDLVRSKFSDSGQITLALSLTNVKKYKCLSTLVTAHIEGSCTIGLVIIMIILSFGMLFV